MTIKAIAFYYIVNEGNLKEIVLQFQEMMTLYFVTGLVCNKCSVSFAGCKSVQGGVASAYPSCCVQGKWKLILGTVLSTNAVCASVNGSGVERMTSGNVTLHRISLVKICRSWRTASSTSPNWSVPWPTSSTWSEWRLRTDTSWSSRT